MFDFRKIFRMTAQPCLLMSADEDFAIEEMTESYLKMMGLTEEMLFARGFFELFPGSPSYPGNKGDGLRQSLEEVIHSGRPQKLSARKYTYYDKDHQLQEKIFEFEHAPVKDFGGEVLFILQTVRELRISQVEHESPGEQDACSLEFCSLPIGI